MTTATLQAKQAAPAAAKEATGILQRQCACGNHTIAGDECAECKKDRNQLKTKPEDGPSSWTSSRGLMPKLAVGASNDPMEAEADRIAEEVLAAPSHAEIKPGGFRIQRFSSPAHSTLKGAPPSVNQVLSGLGQPLDVPLRKDMEQRFGRDFSRVRVHSGGVAAQSARDVSALAYTVGNDIVFGAGQFVPTSPEGRRLIAHELTHVVQQSTHGSVDTKSFAPSASKNHAMVQRQVTIGQLPQTTEVDYVALARQVHAAIYKVGTDEEVVYQALEQLRQDPKMVETLTTTYRNLFDGANLLEDIRGDFSEEELEYALQLMGMGTPGAAQRVAAGPDATNPNLAAKRIRDAVEIWGTDEEAIFATLRPFNRATEDLEQTYQFLYDESLRRRLDEEMGGDELKHALSLLSFDNESFLLEYFNEAQRPFARKILVDIRSVKGTRLDFAYEDELAVEISKRMRTSELMQESQTFAAFGYPESCTQAECPGQCVGKGKQGEPGYVPPDINYNAHVNKAARDYWMGGVDPWGLYMFRLSTEGWNNPFKALVKLFEHQESICDKTLIHCDYLTTVIHHRAFAESIGPDAYNKRVKSGEIAVNLSYWGFRDVTLPATGPNQPEGGYARSPGAVSLQAVQPDSENDLIIGDHVIFWNHLAYDALTFSPLWSYPWRLENALLVDQDGSGNNLYEGHGAPTNERQEVVKGDKNRMLKDIIEAYNGPAEAAIALTKKVEARAAGAAQELQRQFPRVEAGPNAGEWVIKERDDRDENRRRSRRSYELRLLRGVDDPELIGLRDPENPSKMGWVKRPIESAPGRSPSRPT